MHQSKALLIGLVFLLLSGFASAGPMAEASGVQVTRLSFGHTSSLVLAVREFAALGRCSFDEESYRDTSHNPDRWLNRAAVEPTTIFSRANIEHLRLNYDPIPYSSAYVDLYALTGLNPTQLQEVRKVYEKGLNPKGIHFSFRAYQNQSIFFLIGYPSGGDGPYTLIDWAETLVERAMHLETP